MKTKTTAHINSQSRAFVESYMRMDTLLLGNWANGNPIVWLPCGALAGMLCICVRTIRMQWPFFGNISIKTMRAIECTQMPWCNVEHAPLITRASVSVRVRFSRNMPANKKNAFAEMSQD